MSIDSNQNSDPLDEIGLSSDSELSPSNVIDLFLNSEAEESVSDSSGLVANSPEMVKSILSELTLEKASPRVRIALKTYTRVATSKWNEETNGFHIKRAA